MTTRKIMVLLLLHQRKMTSDIYKRMDGYVLHVERAIHVFVLKKLLWKSLKQRTKHLPKEKCCHTCHQPMNNNFNAKKLDTETDMQNLQAESSNWNK